MKRIITAVVVLMAMLLTAQAQTRSQVPLADPYILVDNNLYYAYGTHSANGIEVWVSDNLKEWKYEGLALNKANTTEQRWFWAPEVYYKNGEYIMYYSANEHLYVAKAAKPTGPFKQVGDMQMKPLLGDEKCIDSSVFFDDDGTAWLFFVRFNDGNCIWKCQLADDYITPVKNTLRKCINVTAAWESKLGRVCEGPNVLKHNKRYYLTYSANDYRSQDYGVGYATTVNVVSGTWAKYSKNPVLQRVEGLVGTGHHSIFTDLDGKMRIVFHAHYSDTQVADRLMYIGTMEFDNIVLKMTDDPVIRPVKVSTLGVAAPSVDGAAEVARYDISGRVTTGSHRGVTIVRMSDGTVRKEVRVR